MFSVYIVPVCVDLLRSLPVKLRVVRLRDRSRPDEKREMVVQNEIRENNSQCSTAKLYYRNTFLNV